MPEDIDKALDVLRNGKVRAVDLIRCEGDASIRCINTLGIGLDGWANYFSSKVQRLSGQPVYVLGVLKALWHFRGCRMTVNIDGKSIEKELTMVTVCNGPEEGGGFKVAPEADNSDGYIDLLMIDKMPLLKIAWYLPKFLFKPKKELKGVKRIRCTSIDISCQVGVAVHCDGELLGTDIKNLYLTMEPARLNVVVP
jgi:diacylglycerol kinase (ATP)